MTKPFGYHKKTVVSGSTIEQTIYERPIVHGLKRPSRSKEERKLLKELALKDLTKEQIKEREIRIRKQSMNRAKNTLTRLINANVYQYFNTKGRPYPQYS